MCSADDASVLDRFVLQGACVDKCFSTTRLINIRATTEQVACCFSVVLPSCCAITCYLKSTHVKALDMQQKITAVRCCLCSDEWGKAREWCDKCMDFQNLFVFFFLFSALTSVSQRNWVKEKAERTTYGNILRFKVQTFFGIYYTLVEHHNHAGTVVHCCLW